MGPDAEYASHLEGGRFYLQCCDGCCAHIFPPRSICHHCGSNALTFVPMRGLGTVYSTTVVRARDAEGGPYNLALVDLDEGIRMMSRVEEIAPDAVRIGMRVQARITRAEKPFGAIVVFAPAEVQEHG